MLPPVTPASHISLTPLGAGQSIGKSALVVDIGGRRLLLDCGIHAGFSDERRLPALDELDVNSVDAVLISHLHLDHAGALPYLTERLRYRGPIFMSYGSLAIAPVMLEDARKVSRRKRGGNARGGGGGGGGASSSASSSSSSSSSSTSSVGSGELYTAAQLNRCLERVTPLHMLATHRVAGMEITPYFAGHIIGACMFHVRVGAASFLYTGDFNTTADRHLGAAACEANLRPDLLITESTYGAKTREPKRTRERAFLDRLTTTINRGGKVLVPVFALGRVQELCMLVDQHWERAGLSHVPVYFSGGLSARATNVYARLASYTSEDVREDVARGRANPFDFKHIRTFEPARDSFDADGPMVMFATPGMLHAGTSLAVFMRWAGDARNTIILPGFCESGTVGGQLLRGASVVHVESAGTQVAVCCDIKSLSFSAHADAAGIMRLIEHVAPAAVALVHGEPQSMRVLKARVERELGVPTVMPALLERAVVEASSPLDVVDADVHRDERVAALTADADGRLRLRSLSSLGKRAYEVVMEDDDDDDGDGDEDGEVVDR